MTPEQQAKLEQVAREWLHSIGFSHNALDLFGHHKELAKFLASREAAVLNMAADHHELDAEHWNPFPQEMPTTYNEAVTHSRQQARAQEAMELAAWCRLQVQERRP